MSTRSLIFSLLVALVTTQAAAHGQVQTTTTGVGEGPVLELDGVELEDTRAEDGAPTAEMDEGDYKATSERGAGIIDRTTLGGYGEHDFAVGPGEIAAFRNHRYVIFLHSQISERISAAAEVEFEWAGSPVKRDGVLGHGEVLLEFMVVDLKMFEGLVLRAGVILVPVSRFNLNHEAPSWDLTDRPIAYTSIVPSTWFESGVGFHGRFALGDHQRLSYEVYAVNGLDARIFDGLGLRGARGSHLEDNNHDKAIAARITYSPMLGLEFGTSGYSGAYDLRGHRVNLINLDATWRQGKFEFMGEAVVALIDPGYVEGFSRQSPANTRDAVPTEMRGFYLQAGYHLQSRALWAAMFPEWLQESVFTAVLRYEGKDTDLAQLSAAGDQRRLTFGLNFRPVEQFVLKTDYQLNVGGTDGVSAAPDLWQPAFWKDARFRFVTSIAFLF